MMPACFTSRVRRRAGALLPLTLLALGARASATSSRTYQMDRAHYYRGDVPAAPRLVVLPVATPALRTFRGDTSAPPQLRALLDTIDAHLGAIVRAPRLAPATHAALLDGAPRVRFGCAAEDEPTTRFGGALYSPGCLEVDEETVGRHNQLDVTSGTRAWRERVAAALDSADADHLLIVALEMSDQWPVQKGWSMAKEVRLGTGHSVSIPWLSSLEVPVSVVQLTGLLVDRTGKVVRSGAEGLLAVRTSSAASLMGIQKAVSDDDIARLRVGERRADLPGAPLVWESALETLVAQVAGGAQVQARR